MKIEIYIYKLLHIVYMFLMCVVFTCNLLKSVSFDSVLCFVCLVLCLVVVFVGTGVRLE